MAFEPEFVQHPDSNLQFPLLVPPPPAHLPLFKLRKWWHRMGNAIYKGEGGAYNWSELSECWCMFLLFVIFLGCFKWKRWKNTREYLKERLQSCYHDDLGSFSNLGCFTDFFWGISCVQFQQMIGIEAGWPCKQQLNIPQKNGSRDSSFNKGEEIHHLFFCKQPATHHVCPTHFFFRAKPSCCFRPATRKSTRFGVILPWPGQTTCKLPTNKNEETLKPQKNKRRTILKRRDTFCCQKLATTTWHIFTWWEFSSMGVLGSALLLIGFLRVPGWWFP